MKNILQITTYGMKNISQPITIDFANSTIDNGVKKINNVKGIFGFNGAGKTAIITSIDLYKKTILDPKYLLQNSTIKKLDKLINYKINHFYFSIVLEFDRTIVIKHTIKIEKVINKSYVISFEDISLSFGRTLNDKYKSLVKKDNNDVELISDKRITLNKLDYLFDVDLDYTSVVSRVINKLLTNQMENKELLKDNLSIAEKAIVSLFASVNNIDVYLSDDDSHSNYIIDKEYVDELLEQVTEYKQKNGGWSKVYADETIIPKESFDEYSLYNQKLEKFIKVFKPEVKEIYLDKAEDGPFYHIRRIFKYDDYNVELEFESSGIKHLVKLFTYLLKCSNGASVFVDEIDTNINSVYFEKLILFFRNYGKGQLIFTTHNVESMNSLKGQSRSILALGENNKIDVWVGKGNKSPIKDYVDGFFPNSPMNIEDFDFVNVFLGED